jgi:hypothetical protein
MPKVQIAALGPTEAIRAQDNLNRFAFDYQIRFGRA